MKPFVITIIVSPSHTDCEQIPLSSSFNVLYVMGNKIRKNVSLTLLCIIIRTQCNKCRRKTKRECYSKTSVKAI